MANYQNNHIIIAEEIIISKIYHIRGRQVMLSHDLAELYEVETKVVNHHPLRRWL
ncbi:MAG: ORF6N domain-containing protein [Bacteroidales bacterium]|nr:ORF6N domain-containing protein [Bacteroidales bacterium]